MNGHLTELLSKISPVVINQQYPETFRLSEGEGKGNKYEGTDDTLEYYPLTLHIERVVYDRADARVYNSSSWAIYGKRELKIKL
mgnify:FL=1